jgi:hypothetical protein
MKICLIFACLILLSNPGNALVARANELPGNDVYSMVAEPWLQADALFRKEPRWLGGDDAYSIDLGAGRVLWLFGDSFIARGAYASRSEAKLIRNSVAIQNGYDPSSASIKFYWRGQNTDPLSFFPETEGVWYWPGHGVRLNNRLLIFLMKIRASTNGLGFEVFGWDAVGIDNLKAEPSEWKMHRLKVRQNDFGVIIGSASVLHIGEYVYAWSAQERHGHPAYLVRWHLSKALRGDLLDPEWWIETTKKWSSQSLLTAEPPAVFAGAQTEFTVHYEKRLRRFFQVQTEGFGAADLSMRWSGALTGNWSALSKFYRPPETARSEVLIYAGKSHPELRGADLILTYVVNSTEFGKLITDTSIYYPRFLKVKFKREKMNPAKNGSKD